MNTNGTNILITILKGMGIGGTMLVPGCSGGSMAIILGIYDRLVSSVSSFTKNVKENFLFLFFTALGGGLGMLLFAKPLLSLIDRYPRPMLYFFIGAVAGSVPLIYRKAEISRITFRVILYPLIGIGIVALFALMPQDGFGAGSTGGLSGLFMLVLSGIIAAVALVLPGISVSYMLLLMGMYDTVMEAISGLQLSYLVPLGVGVFLGVILTTRILENAMKRYPQATYLIILGFMAASMLEVFPGLPQGAEWIICPAALAGGFILISLISSREEAPGGI